MLHVLYCPSVNMDIHGLLEEVQRRATKMITGLEHLCCEGRLRGMGLLNLENASREDLTAAFQYLKAACMEAGEGQGHIVIGEGEFVLR